MSILNNILRDVLSDTSDCCFLCFNTISEVETPCSIEDEVSLGIDIETTEVLYELIYTVLGDKVLDSISAHNMICQKCTGTVINCYKFIQQCRQNIEQLHCTIDSLQKHAQNIREGNNNYKSLFVALDTSDNNVELYYDKHQNNHQHLLIKRFQRIYKDSQQFDIDTEAESNYSPDNENCAVRRKQSSFLQSIELADIVHDKDDLNNLKCKTCLKVYPSVMRIKHHYLRVHAPKDFKCPHCPRSFGSFLILKQHKKDSHCKAVCSQCGKAYNNLHSLRRHERGHNRLNLISKRQQNCYLYSIELADIVHDKADLNNLKCKICLKLYSSVTKIRQHYFREHAPKDLKCSHCPRSFGSPIILKQHIKDSHTKAVCSQCGKAYTNLHSLRRHESAHNRLHLICHTCGKVYKGKLSFDNHIEKKLCEKMRKSNAEAKLSCDYCGKKYAQKGALSLHIRIEHENGKALICDWCGKKLGSISRLKDHILTHTKQKDFECEQCGGKFVTKTSLLYHTRRHTGEKPYKCEYCELSFLSASRRSTHVKRHHTQSKVECDICHGKFNGSLARHRRRHFDARSRLYCNPPDSVVLS